MSDILSATNLERIILKLYDVEAVKYGSFVLKSGLTSPMYFDLRVIVSFPELMAEVSEILWQIADKAGCQYASVCGVPYTALPLASIVAANHNIPMLIRRKEAKGYGTKKLIEGRFSQGDRCLIIEDVVTSGSSVLETVETLASEGLVVRDAIVLLDREQGGKDKLKSKNINLHSVISISLLLDVLVKAGRITKDQAREVHQFIEENKTYRPGQEEGAGDADKKPKVISHKERASACTHALSKKLFTIMDEKKTNLAFSVDVTSSKELLKLVEEVGPHICVLKTHIDILEDFTPDTTKKLVQLADKHNFLIFEDRKFCDIGNTVKHQYEGGVYQISDWAHIVNANVLPGPGIIQGLKEVGLPKGRGCLILAEMSCQGNLATDQYTKSAIEFAESNKDYVMGFISQKKLSTDPNMVHMTPGVKLEVGGDTLGQQYLTPDIVIGQKQCDIIIVGRGILKAANPAAAAKAFQEAGYKAYQTLL